MKQSTFPNLPAELLFSIFEHLEFDDLLNVAKLCRRLNLITLPVVTERAGFPESHKAYVVKLGRKGHSDELTALVIDISLNTMGKFYCVLSDKRHWHDHDTPDSQISDFTRNIRRVNQLISRLSSVQSVSLVIASWGSPWSFGRSVAQPFTDAVLDMMRASIQKSCTSFQILHSHPATHPGSMQTPYRFELVNGVRIQKLSRSLAKYLFPSESLGSEDLQGDGWKYRKLHKPNAVPRQILSIPGHNNVTNLDISCDFLLVPPFSTWIFEIMKSSPITTLTLSVPYFVTQQEFQHYLLPRVIASAPNLQEIRLACVRSYILTSVSEKLPLFPLLRRVTFAMVSFPGLLAIAPVEPMIENRVPHLVSFTGSAQQAAYLFQRSSHYPNLQFVNIIIDQGDEVGGAVLFRNFLALDAAFSSRNLTPCISVCLVNYGRRPDSWAINKPLSDSFTRPFRSVSRLTLDLPRFSTDTSEKFSEQIDTTLAWVDMFRGLEHLTLVLVGVVSLERRREKIIAALNAEFSGIEISINVVGLSNTTDSRSHSHWSNARDSWVRGTREIPTMPFFLPPTPDSYICSHF